MTAHAIQVGIAVGGRARLRFAGKRRQAVMDAGSVPINIGCWLSPLCTCARRLSHAQRTSDRRRGAK